MDIITVPFGYLLAFLYGFINNYGVTLIIFTLLIKLLLLPLSFKQQKSAVNMRKVQPLITELQEKYKNDKEKLSAETMALYKKHNANPLSGCLPLLLQFPILIGLYQVINRPLTYMYNLTADQIAEITERLRATMEGVGITVSNAISQITVAQYMTQDILTEYGVKLPVIDFNFLGLNLADTPTYTVVSVLWIIPILSGLSAFAAQKIGQTMQPPQQQASGSGGAMNSMLYIFPIMSVFICFSMPAGVGFYWTISSLFGILQQWGLTYYYERKAAKQPDPEPEPDKKPNITSNAKNQNGNKNKKKK